MIATYVVRLMSLTRLVRYFVIAMLAHLALLIAIGSIKIVAVILNPIPRISFGDPPFQPADRPEDITTPFRDSEEMFGVGGQGPGGTPVAGGEGLKSFDVSGDSSKRFATLAGSIDVVGSIIDMAALGSRPVSGAGLDTTAMGDGPNKIGISGIYGKGSIFGNRDPDRRNHIIVEKGLKKEEGGVLAGLRWLKEHQEANGSWKLSRSDDAATALALLCFLGHGETPDNSKEFGLTVQNSLEWLVNRVDQDGFVPGRNMYAQGLTALALCEGFAMTQAPSLRDPAERAIGAIVRAQNTAKANPANAGGWRYAPDANDADVSVAGWQIMALKSARNAGLDVPQLAFDNATQYLWRMYGGSGFGYDKPANSPGTTAIGVLCLQFMNRSDDPKIIKALDFLHTQKVDWDKSDGGFVLYGWYYITQAMFQGGGAYWEYWNHQIRDTLVKSQAEDGHWSPPPRSNEAKDLAEPVYATTLCVLTLEVYYRYLPIHKMLELPQPAAPIPAPGPTAKK